MTPVTRRDFIRVTATAGGGFRLAIALPPGLWSASGGSDTSAELTAFIHIGADDIVTITVPRPDMGQGSRTVLPMLIAEELDADWSQVRVEQADLDEARYGSQYAGGSTSVRAGWEPLRRAGATARWMLVEAAARGWGVEAAECITAQGLVRHPPSGRTARYGALAAEAAALAVPEDPPRKDPAEYRLIGHPIRQLDAPEIVVGATVFGLDVERPGMIHAVVERSPVFGGRLVSVDPSAALAVPGVRHVIRIPGSVFRMPPNEPLVADGVAVLADNTWAALQGRRALSLEWAPGPGETESTETFWEQCEAAAGRPEPTIVRDDGDVTAAMAGAFRTVRGVYRLPFLAHAQMEPLNCLAEVTRRGCEIWAPTQNPAGAREVAAAVLGRPPDSIQVHVIRSGG
ncbi:MAG: molybdopterin cofactor-binding domain-containing protein, partial [Gemmatimonadota bacterium]